MQGTPRSRGGCIDFPACLAVGVGPKGLGLLAWDPAQGLAGPGPALAPRDLRPASPLHVRLRNPGRLSPVPSQFVWLAGVLSK